jgi:ribosomal protein L16/L10AE
MAHSFGKPVGNAAQLAAGQKIMSIYVNEPNITLARKALKKANNKLPVASSITINKL